MRVIIAGSRHARGALWEHALLDVLRAFQASFGTITCVVSGKQRGMDTIGEEWARQSGIPVDPHPADWGRGRRGGPERNARMVAVADALVCLHIGGNGSADVIRRARQKGLLVIEMDMRKY